MMNMESNDKVQDFHHHTSLEPGQVRLFQVHWGPGDTIVGTIKTFALESKQKPRFMATSYFCGKQPHQKPIYLHRGNHNTPRERMSVLETLYPFLELACEYQGFEPELWWWVDSISINPEDAKEKRRQVASMKDIYAAAERTIIWLGPKSHDSDLAIDFIHELNSKRLDVKAEDGGQHIAELQHPRNSSKWKALEGLLCRPWWRRVWTLQELIIARHATFYCGRRSFRRSRFKSAVYIMGMCRTREFIPMANDWWHTAWSRRRILLYHESHKSMPVVGTMAYLSDHEVTLPHDKIYALLGMIPQREIDWIGEANYEMPIESVFIDFTIKHILANESLDIILFSHIFNNTAVEGGLQRLPSWVPDWRARVTAIVTPLMVSQSSSTHIGDYRPLGFKGTASYRAAGSVAAVVSSNLRSLKCGGIILDTIDGLGALVDADGKCTYEGQLVQCSESSSRDVRLPEYVMESIARSLVLGRYDKYLLIEAPESFNGDFAALCKGCVKSPKLVQPEFLHWFIWNQHLLIKGFSLPKLVELWSQRSYQSGTRLGARRDTSRDNINHASQQFRRNPRSQYADEPRHTQTQRVQHDMDPDHVPSGQGPQHDTESHRLSGLHDLRSASAAFESEGFLARFQRVMIEMQRRLMVTSEGLIGMAPGRAKKGDVVAILYGCNVPVLLRPVKDNSSYEVIGECYVDHYMDGEAVTPLGRRTPREFTLV